MGLFNFIKDVGASVLGASNEEQNNEQIEKKIIGFVTKDLQLAVVDFNVDVQGETAYLKGEAGNSEQREKLILAVGNIEGIAQVNDDAMTTFKVSTVEPRFYTVKKGDSLSKIAKEYYNDPMKYQQIFEANKPMLADPDKIYPGQTLRIPQDIA
ncbi:peptidoglycan-binding protein LysM [bacterium]|nr:peptidoglycan-binding protein LysM [bacterium]